MHKIEFTFLEEPSDVAARTIVEMLSVADDHLGQRA